MGFWFQSFVMLRLTHADRFSSDTVGPITSVISYAGSTHSAGSLTHSHSDLPEEVKVDGGVFGLDERPETPKEVRSLKREKLD